MPLIKQFSHKEIALFNTQRINNSQSYFKSDWEFDAICFSLNRNLDPDLFIEVYSNYLDHN